MINQDSGFISKYVTINFLIMNDIFIISSVVKSPLKYDCYKQN
jgi:hypothetical protein